MGERDEDKDNKKRKLFKNRKNIKKEFLIRTLIFFFNSFIFFYNFIHKVWNNNSGDVDILLSSYIFILFKIYIKM